MDTPRTTTGSLVDSGDQQDWDLEILQALVSPSSPEDAVLACAAAWMNFLNSKRVAVAIFDSPDSCRVAHGQREENHLTIYVGQESVSVAALLNPESLCSENGPCVISDPDIVFCWPEHMSVVMVNVDEANADDERLGLLENVSRRLLSQWTSPQTAFASPAHMESMAEFSAGAGHEINNPLGSIIGQAQMLLKKEDRADRRQALETIGAQAWRIRDMIGDAMLFGRPPQPEFRRCNLVELVSRVIDNVGSDAPSASGKVSLQVADKVIESFCDESQISTLVSHLLRNAVEASRELDDQRISIELSREGSHAVLLTIDDCGGPIPEEIRRHMFDPFYSGRQAGRGLGFGLCHCWQIVRMHNGVLTHQPTHNGNRFTVVLPAEAE